MPEIKPEVKTRTIQQNKALHLMFKQLAQLLNDSGIDFKNFPLTIDCPWSAITVKEIIWKSVMKAYCGKDSTTEMTTTDIDKIFEVIVKAVGERTGAVLQWPSVETLMFKSLKE